jgi:hypothetical protein
VVKHIILLRDDRPLWNDVARRLRDLKAKITALDTEWTAEDVIGLSPDMIVTNLPNLARLKISLRRIPKVAIQTHPHEAHFIPISRLEWNLEVVEWPAGMDEFIQVTSRQLTISPRKSFACIFQAFPDGDDAVAVAQTVNIGMTGLAFKSIAEFQVGQPLAIVLDLPGERASLKARARIVRSEDEDDNDPRTTYGAEYVDPSDQFRKSLKRFIHTY